MTDNSLDSSNKLARINGLTQSLLIPERTRSLLWTTGKPLSDISASFMGSVYVQGEKEPHDFYSEPSLIWTHMPVEPNNELMSESHYYPTYMELSPKEKFQYLNWLRDVSRPTNLSYVYLYFYGLERHLFLGDFENAVAEIKVLLSSHKIGLHAYRALALSCIARDRLDMADEIPGIFNQISEMSVILMAQKKMPLTAGVAIGLASRCGFKNKRYIESNPDLFNEELQKNIEQLEHDTGSPFFAEFDFANCEPIPLSFTNISLTAIADSFKVRDIFRNQNFKDAIYDLLQNTQHSVRVALARLHGKDTSKTAPTVLIGKSSRQSDNKRLESMIAQLVANRDKSTYANDEAPHKNGYIEYPYVSMDLAVKSSGKFFNQCMKRLAEIEAISKVNPEKSNELALALFTEGYRSPKMYERIAINYRKQKDLKAEIQLLLQMKRDFGYDGHDERLRQALSRLEKQGELEE